MTNADPSPGDQARGLLRRAERASLGTLMAGVEPAVPYVSLVLVAVDAAGAPLLLLSDLADHAKNLAADLNASLLIDGTAGRRDPLTGPRVSLIGQIAPLTDAALKRRFVARHPGAEVYKDFADFHLYRMAVARAHIVAGFGRIEWIEADDLLLDGVADGFGAAEAGIIDEVQDQYCHDIKLIYKHILRLDGDDWRLIGLDPEGADLRGVSGLARLDFGRTIGSAEGARDELLRLSRTVQQG